MKERIIGHKRKLIAFGAAALVLVMGGIFVAADAYPIAIVNGAPVSARRFSKNYSAAAVYYANLRKANAPVRDMDTSAIEREVLERLIDAKLIDEGARREVGADLDVMVDDRVSASANEAELRTATRQLYGLDYADFKREVLVPQAEMEILAGRLYLRGEALEDWLRNARQTASVFILSSRFAWGGEGVVEK